jgi:hypothetical protein
MIPASLAFSWPERRQMNRRSPQPYPLDGGVFRVTDDNTGAGRPVQPASPNPDLSNG